MMLESTSQFWAVRDAWSAAVQARQAAKPGRGGGKFRRPTLTEQRARWDANASKYLANRQGVLAQSQGVAITAPDVAAPVLALLEGLPTKLLAEMDTRLSAVMFRAFDDWPVSSGFSKASLSLSFTPKGTTFEAVLADTAPYSLLIRGGPTRKLIGVPGKAAAIEATEAALKEVSVG
jgi:hypothetical protein